MSTIQVKPWGKDQGDFVLINEKDFNPEVHELHGSEKSKAKGGMTAKELREKLTELNVEFKVSASKDELQDLFDAAAKPE